LCDGVFSPAQPTSNQSGTTHAKLCFLIPAHTAGTRAN
jgi:hypothetical protein